MHHDLAGAALDGLVIAPKIRARSLSSSTISSASTSVELEEEDGSESLFDVQNDGQRFGFFHIKCNSAPLATSCTAPAISLWYKLKCNGVQPDIEIDVGKQIPGKEKSVRQPSLLTPTNSLCQHNFKHVPVKDCTLGSAP